MSKRGGRHRRERGCTSKGIPSIVATAPDRSSSAKTPIPALIFRLFSVPFLIPGIIALAVVMMSAWWWSVESASYLAASTHVAALSEDGDDALIESMTDGGWRSESEAARAFRDGDAPTETYREVLAAPNADVQSAILASNALADGADRRDYEAIREAAFDPAREGRFRFAMDLARSGDHRAAGDLVQLLQADPDPQVRRVAARSLESFVAQQPVRDALAVAARGDADPDVRCNALRSLGQAEPIEVRPIVEEAALNEPDERTAELARRILMGWGSR